MKSKNKRTKNNISKPAYDEDTVKESLIKLASETPEEEAEMLLDMELKQLFDEFINIQITAESKKETSFISISL